MINSQQVIDPKYPTLKSSLILGCLPQAYPETIIINQNLARGSRRSKKSRRYVDALLPVLARDRRTARMPQGKESLIPPITVTIALFIAALGAVGRPQPAAAR
ncbi:MAG: hypothetical protein E6G90_19980 [Alphaproteobacteria bacterium]|nr:MAG: hypothetical protein E6G90_19980 [Alphaproteobacteria bacterium]